MGSSSIMASWIPYQRLKTVIQASGGNCLTSISSVLLLSLVPVHLEIFFRAYRFQAKAALPALRKTQGCIILTSSGASTGVYSSWGAYGASKAAMNHFAKQLACEEPDVTSISVKPGVVDTNMQKELREVHSSIMAEKDNAKFMGLHKEGKLLKPEQPGFLMARLVLDPPNELSGQCLRCMAPLYSYHACTDRSPAGIVRNWPASKVEERPYEIAAPFAVSALLQK